MPSQQTAVNAYALSHLIGYVLHDEGVFAISVRHHESSVSVQASTGMLISTNEHLRFGALPRQDTVERVTTLLEVPTAKASL